MKLTLIKIILVQLVPLVGVLFLGWELFEIVTIYLLESLCIYLVYELDHYFINKETRIPFIFAAIQLFFALFPLIGILAGNGLAIYYVLYANEYQSADISKMFEAKLDQFNLIYPFITLFILELISYYLKKRVDINHDRNSHWRLLRRILYSNVFIAIGAIVLSFIPHFGIVLVIFFISLKMVMEYGMEDKRFWNNIRHYLMERKKNSTK